MREIACDVVFVEPLKRRGHRIINRIAVISACGRRAEYRQHVSISGHPSIREVSVALELGSPVFAERLAPIDLKLVSKRDICHLTSAAAGNQSAHQCAPNGPSTVSAVVSTRPSSGSTAGQSTAATLTRTMGRAGPRLARLGRQGAHASREAFSGSDAPLRRSRLAQV